MSSATTNSLRRTLSAVDMSKIYDQHVEPKNAFARQQQGKLDIWCSILTQNSSSLPPPYVHPLVKQSKSCLSLKSLEICTENLGSESGSDGYPYSDISLSDTEEEEEGAIEQVVVVDERSEIVKVDKNKVVAANYIKKYSSPPSAARRSFPPPLKSLSKPGGGGIQMKTHRKDGRLVLESVSVPTSQNWFKAQRKDGRLVLTFTSSIPESKSLEHVFETDEEVEFDFSPDNEIEEPRKEEEEEDKGLVLGMTSTRVPELPTRVMKVHRSALMVNKFTGLTNNMNNWSSSSNLKNKLEKILNSPSTKLLPQSLPVSPPTSAPGAPPPPRRSSQLIPYTLPQQTIGVTAATVEASSSNRYEYFWRNNTSSMVSVGGIHHSLNQQSLPNNKNPYHHNNNNSNNLIRNKNNYITNNNSNNFSSKGSATTTKGRKDYKEEKQYCNGEKIVDQHLMVPAYCKPEHIRRSLVFWEPHCIATS
ncbi:protein FAF-like, chloroplastic [Papaver somniferum]|uniref:protein FAF-like, chloroplastic n=1 Tax=Papaver somniferum TaxID=3469 RepID=UPI000E6FF40D|nr:protein FAF-like, chloroplastic [Papaver somniferum]